MFLFACLINQIFSLLTFTSVSFYPYTNGALRLEVTLVDEDFQIVQEEKLLLIEPNPISQFSAEPPLNFTGTLITNLCFYLLDTYALSLSCDGCEIFKTNSVYNDQQTTNTTELTPLSTSVSAYHAIEIRYFFLLDGFLGAVFPIYTFLINKEIFYYEINTEDKILIVTFYKSGEKKLIIYFLGSTASFNAGTLINIPVISYNSIEFLETFVRFI